MQPRKGFWWVRIYAVFDRQSVLSGSGSDGGIFDSYVPT